MSCRLRTPILAAAAFAALVLFVMPAEGARGRSPSRTVGVVDYAFVPARMTVRPGTRIVWRWDAANSAPHDVKLVRAPRGVRRFTSPVATAGITYARRLTAKGTYRLVCTYHRTVMRQTIVVR